MLVCVLSPSALKCTNICASQLIGKTKTITTSFRSILYRQTREFIITAQPNLHSVTATPQVPKPMLNTLCFVHNKINLVAEKDVI